MHFRTPKCTFPTYSADDLIRLRPAARKEEASHVSPTKAELPAHTEIHILEYSR